MYMTDMNISKKEQQNKIKQNEWTNVYWIEAHWNSATLLHTTAIEYECRNEYECKKKIDYEPDKSYFRIWSEDSAETGMYGQAVPANTIHTHTHLTFSSFRIRMMRYWQCFPLYRTFDTKRVYFSSFINQGVSEQRFHCVLKKMKTKDLQVQDRDAEISNFWTIFYIEHKLCWFQWNRS